MTPTQPPNRERPLHLAIDSLKTLGLASGAWGIFFVFAWGYFNRSERFRPYFIALGLIVWLIPGVMFYLCGWMLHHNRRRRDAVWAMITTIGQGLFAIAALAASMLLPPVSPIPILLCFLWVITLAQLFTYLRNSFPLLESDTQRHHGFEITQVHAIQPTDHSTDNLREK